MHEKQLKHDIKFKSIYSFLIRQRKVFNLINSILHCHVGFFIKMALGILRHVSSFVLCLDFYVVVFVFDFTVSCASV